MPEGTVNVTRQVNAYREIGRRLIKRWYPLLEGLRGEDAIINCAILLENEWREGGNLLPESDQIIAEFTASTLAGPSGQQPQIATFRHYLMPLVRRVYPNLFTNQLVGVQPMTGPAAQIFYLKYFYTGMSDMSNPWTTTPTRKGATTAGTEYGNFAGDTWFVDPYYSLQTVRREPVDTGGGSIGAGMDYSAAPATGIHVCTTGGGRAPVFDNTGKVYALMGTQNTYAASMGAGESLALVEITGWVNGAAPAALTATVLAYLGPVALAYNNVTTGAILNVAGVFRFSLTVSHLNPLGGAGNYNYLLSTAEVNLAIAAGQPYFGMNTATYDINMENRPEMPELSLEIHSENVGVQTRKLRTTWSVEASQDMRAMHQIDAEKELISVLAAEIAAEIDRETLNNLITNSGHRRDYNYSHPLITGGFAIAGGGYRQWDAAGTFPAPAAGNFYPVMGSGNFDDRNRALLYQCVEMANDIYRQSLRGSANWIVTSPTIAAKFEQLSDFESTATSETIYNVGIQESGILASKFKLIKDPLFPNDLILMGYKGPSFMDSGYFYCPYVPIQLTPTIMDPRTFNPVKGIITRYGKLMVENGERMYGIVKVDNLTAVGTTVPSGFPIQTSRTVSGSDLVHGNTDLV